VRLSIRVVNFRCPFDSLVHDLVELAFRELGHARITMPPFGGRPLAAWVAELRRRREGILTAFADEQRMTTVRKTRS